MVTDHAFLTDNAKALLGIATSCGHSIISCYSPGASRWLSGNESACQSGDAGSIPGSGRSLGGRHGSMLQYSCLEDPWTEVRGGLQSMGLQWVQHSLASEHAHYSLTPGTIGSPAPQADGSLPPFGCPCCWSQVRVPMHSEAKQTKYQSLERRKVYYKGQAKRIGSSCSGDPNNSVTLKKIFF